MQASNKDYPEAHYYVAMILFERMSVKHAPRAVQYLHAAVRHGRWWIGPVFACVSFVLIGCRVSVGYLPAQYELAKVLMAGRGGVTKSCPMAAAVSHHLRHASLKKQLV